MIVADCNVLTYLIVPGDRTSVAKKAFELDPYWTAPGLWRSEFLSVLSTYVRNGVFEIPAACEFMKVAEDLVGVLPNVHLTEVLSRSKQSGCSSYDCEYVAAAETQQAVLLTEDKKVLAAFPKIARSLTEFVGQHP